MQPYFNKAVARLWMLLCVLPALPVTADHGTQTWEASYRSVVSVKPSWPGYTSPGIGAPDGTAPEGSGVVITTTGSLTSNLILTAAHVVRNAVQLTIRTHSQSLYNAQIIWSDTVSDLALLRLDNPLPALQLDENPVTPGEHVCALGNPFGLGISMSCGVVSGPIRQGLGFNAVEKFIQTDAAINPGSSGGALVNATGQLVGMVAAIFTKDADIDAGVNFVISNQLIIERWKILEQQ